MQDTRSSRCGFASVRAGIACCLAMHLVWSAWPTRALAHDVLPSAPYAAGMKQLEYIDPQDGGRPMDIMMIYPAAPAAADVPFKLFMATNLQLYKDAPIVADGLRHPLVVFSHGAGGNGSIYAWFGQYLASRGYIVAMIYHYRANTYDTTALYLRNRIWQRPRDVALDISHLLADPVWGPHIDAGQIGIAGHSQGGFTSLWIGGASVNPELFVRYQRGWKNNEVVPAYIRDQMTIDAEPVRNLRDDRVRAAFAMAPGDIQGFGMDEDGLRRMAIPAYVIVGAGDTATPPEDNAAFAVKHMPQARLDVLQGPVGHEIFDNECDQIGRDNYPDACNDAPGVDRAKLHEYIGDAARRFFDANLEVQRDAAN